MITRLIGWAVSNPDLTPACNTGAVRYNRIYISLNDTVDIETSSQETAWLFVLC